MFKLQFSFQGPLSRIFLKERQVVIETCTALAKYLLSKNLKPYQFLKQVVDHSDSKKSSEPTSQPRPSRYTRSPIPNSSHPKSPKKLLKSPTNKPIKVSKEAFIRYLKYNTFFCHQNSRTEDKDGFKGAYFNSKDLNVLATKLSNKKKYID